MLHHAFEHMDEPLSVLMRLQQLLKKGKYILIRTPMMGKYSWKKFRENWMDIDAPRHLIIHTPDSIGILAEKAGLSQSLVSSFEKTPWNPTLGTLLRIASVLEVNLGDVISQAIKNVSAARK